MSTIDRVRAWARDCIPTEITTGILRGEGVSDAEISAAYTEIIDDPNYTVAIERGIPTIIER